MRNIIAGTVVGVSLFVGGAVTGAQGRQSAAVASTSIELTGCVSVTPSAAGQYALIDAASGGTYRLSGKGIQKYAGKRVTVVGGPRSRRVSMRFGLWPSPNAAAQAGAIDPAQESIARQPGGAASGAEAKFPEFHVARMRGIEGACQ